jgi:hypothetical protein
MVRSAPKANHSLQAAVLGFTPSENLLKAFARAEEYGSLGENFSPQSEKDY